MPCGAATGAPRGRPRRPGRPTGHSGSRPSPSPCRISAPGALKVAHGHFLASGTFAGFLESRLLHAVHAKPWPQPAWITATTHWAVDQPTLMVVAAYGSVAFELGFWLGLCSHRLRLVAWATAVAFHTGIRLTTGIGFMAHVQVCLIMAIATAVLVARERRRPPPSAVEALAPTTSDSDAAAVAPTVTAALAGSLVVLLAARWLVPADLVLALRAPLVTRLWPLGVRISGTEADLVLLMGGALTAAATTLWIVRDWRRARCRVP